MEGLEKIRELKAWFNSLPDRAPDMMKESFKDIAPVAEELVIEQLDRGERGDGSKLPNYSPVSVRVFGKTPGPMNMHDTGAFWFGVTLDVRDDGVEVIGRDIKTDMLQLTYGANLIDLQEGSKEILEKNHLAPELEVRIKNSIP